MREKLEQVLRAIEEQDAQLKAAYERLDPGDIVSVSHAALVRLDELCTPQARTFHAPVAPPWTALRG